MITCSACGKVNPEGATECESCAESILLPPARQLSPSPNGSDRSPVHRRDSSCYLVADAGPLAGTRFPISTTGLRVGRHPNQCQIVIQDPEVSRFHAKVYLGTEGEVRIEDSSANGTYVNDRRIHEAHLRPGDKVRFGLNRVDTFTCLEESDKPAQADSTANAGAKETPAPLRHDAIPALKPTIYLGPDTDILPPANARLQLIIDQYAVKTFPLDVSGIVLGRRPGRGGVVIDHPGVSDAHARIVFGETGKACLEDMKSAEGTLVNGQSCSEHILREGDLIQLGTCTSPLLLYREARRHAIQLRQIEMNRPVTRMGRDPRNEVRLEHPTVSLFHAEIHKHDDIFEIVDKGSSNGTYVNGKRLSNRQPLKPRDRITLGAIQLNFDGSQIEQQSAGPGVWLNAYNLCRTVRDSSTGKPRLLLDRVSMAVEPGEFVGLLGRSGSGKTTLMHSLSGFGPVSEGLVAINNCNLYQYLGALRPLMGYVPQDDILHLSLTVRECLYYAARLRLPDDYSERDIWKQVTQVIESVNLLERADATIQKLSGGERKRVSLGIELLSNPSLLFMDEPTAGQDPGTEMELMQLFRSVANRGSTVIMTTHLLGSFSLLDKVAVLVGGRLGYFGPGQQMLPYFRVSRPTDVYDRLKTRPPDEWAKQYLSSEAYREYVANPQGLDEHIPPKAAPIRAEVRPVESPRSGFRQLRTLIARVLVLKFKDSANISGLLLPPPLIAGLMGLMLRHSPNDPKTLFISVIVVLWFSCSAAVREVVDEQAIYGRERQRNLTIPAYLGSKLIYLASLAAIQTVLFVLMASLLGIFENHIFEVCEILWLTSLNGALIGLLISTLSPSPERALQVFPLALIPQLLLAGMLIPVSGLTQLTVNPNATQWVETRQSGMSPVLAPVSALVVSRWGLEALADLYTHDQMFSFQSEREHYSFAIPNVISVTRHPHDNEDVRNIAKFEMSQMNTGTPYELPQLRLTSPDTLFYFGILAGYAAAMVALIAVFLKRKDTMR
jgi:ABC-type multidrug transport system ATPase subunit/pSer/pThr/pTyr-binding forkhead associated (FHA) protein